MYKRVGLGTLTAGILALAAPAHAVTVDYTGLGFNAHPSQQGPFGYYFSTLADDLEDYPGNTSDLATPTDLSPLGQAIYQVTGNSIDGIGGLNGGTITFSQGSKALSFSGGVGNHDITIMGGTLNISNDPNTVDYPWPLDFLDNCGILNPCPQTPGVQLPTNLGLGDLGFVYPQYYLTGSLSLSIDGSAPMEFVVCESILGDGLCGDALSDGTSDPIFFEPYNTLNVGDNGGATDLSMFLYLRTEDCKTSDCPFYDPAVDEPDQYYEREATEERVDYCDWRDDDCRKVWKNGKWKYYLTTYTDWQLTDWCNKNDEDECKKVKGEYRKADKDAYLKIALWGAQPQQTTVPEPATLSLLGLGLLGLGLAARRRPRAAA